MDLIQLKCFYDKAIIENPNLKDDLTNLYELCKDNIEDGESVINEVHLCYSEMQDLIEESKNKN